MPRTAKDVEAYLLRLERRFETLDDGTFVISSGAAAPPVVVRVAPPVVVMRADIGKAPTGAVEVEARVFRRLLELNSKDLVHASYGVADGTIEISAALELDNLDINEVEASLADIDLALATHVTEIRSLY
jgi:hypothetical protein